MICEVFEDWCSFLMWCLIILIEKDEINREIIWMFLMFKLLFLFKEFLNNGVMLVYVFGDGYFGNVKVGEEGKYMLVVFLICFSFFILEGVWLLFVMFVFMICDLFLVFLCF